MLTNKIKTLNEMSFYIEDINISVILSYSLQKLISNKTCDSDIHMMSILLD